MDAQTNFPNTVYFIKIRREAARRRANTWDAKLGVCTDNSNIQGQGAESQQSCHDCPGQQSCPATQRAEVDEGPVGRKHHSEERENTPPSEPSLKPHPAHSMTKAL